MAAHETMTGPRVTIDLARIERNTRTVADACAAAGISVFGVTKGTCGMPHVARAMLRGGAVGIGESRFENIRRLRDSGIDCPIMLLRSPPLSRVEEVVADVDVSLHSELVIIEELSRVAERMARVHDIILMVDLGDLREGIWPDDLDATVEKAVSLPGVRIAGLGTNLTCFGAILPSEDNMQALLAYARTIESRFGIRLEWISGGNSSSLPLLLSGAMPAGINNLRIGEAILQGGRDTFRDEPWVELDRNTFVLAGELLEVKCKPSVPIGRMGVDAFGRRPVFEDRGTRLRGILNIGREDVLVEGLDPVDPGVQVLGASSDHLVLDLTDLRPAPQVGQPLEFRMDYGALLAVMTSEYVEKVPMREPAPVQLHPSLRVLTTARLSAVVEPLDLERRFHDIGYRAQVEAVAELERFADDGDLAAALDDGGRAVLLGSDHRVTAAGMKALASRVDAFGMLWFDDRAGFLPPSEPSSDRADASVLRHALSGNSQRGSVMPQLSPENVVLIGVREVAPAEAGPLRESALTVFTIADIDALGIREVMRQALRRALAGTRGLYVSYSPTATDLRTFAPGSGGMTPRETHMAMEIVAQSTRPLAMDVVGLEPGQDPGVARECAGFVLSCFGKRIL